MGQEQSQNSLEKGTYEIIQGRLHTHKTDLVARLNTLNKKRQDVFGNVPFKLISNDRINTDNNCIARDIVAFGDTCLFGYNVHFGLRNKINVADVFSCYEFRDGHFHPSELKLINDATFELDFQNLYKYYRNTIFAKFARIGNYLHMIFQVSEDITDVKSFKWLVNDASLRYIDNRSDHEYVYPDQHDFDWVTPPREMHKYGKYPHVSIEDKVFVETVGGDLTVKIEDNTDDGQGILSEPVAFADQTLDDADYQYAALGNLFPLKIKPYQEAARYFVYNNKVKEVKKIPSIENAAVQLPDNQGLLFPNGYYLQTGAYKLFEKSVENVKFQSKIQAVNGEDYLFVFYQKEAGVYLLLAYNIIEQLVKTPIICNGYTILENGELCYFNSEKDATKHHVIQIWQTPFSKEASLDNPQSDSLLYKIGNKDIVRAMAECHELINLLNKEDSYADLYDDVSKLSNDILDSYYWITEEETAELNKPLHEINLAAQSAIDEYEKVVALRKHAQTVTKELEAHCLALFDEIKYAKFSTIDEYVAVLSSLRKLRGETITLLEVKYTKADLINGLEQQIVEETEKVSASCVQFLLRDNALEPFRVRVEEKKESIETVTKVVAAKKLEESLNEVGTDLELLIEIVNNLQIEDATHTAKIIDGISLIFSSLNKTKAQLVSKRKQLGIEEAKIDFGSQLKLLEQSIINYLDVAITIEKCDDFLTKLSVQLEELEARFSEYDAFIEEIGVKREAVYNAFEERKVYLIQEKNRKTQQIIQSAERILKGIKSKALRFNSPEDINGYFASDIMVTKVFDLIKRLNKLEESGKAEELDTALKTAKEEALRKLKDKKELFVEGENIIKFGAHNFGVNTQALEISIVLKEDVAYYHLSGTNFYQKVTEELLHSPSLWQQALVSENDEVYRAEFLAYTILKEKVVKGETDFNEQDFKELVSNYINEHYNEGYVKGIHDADGQHILSALVKTYEALGVLSFSPSIRAKAQFYWNNLSEEKQAYFLTRFKGGLAVLELFPKAAVFNDLIIALKESMAGFSVILKEEQEVVGSYLVAEFKTGFQFTSSKEARKIEADFTEHLVANKALIQFENNVKEATVVSEKIGVVKQWVKAFLGADVSLFYLEETVALLIYKDKSTKENNADASVLIKEMLGDHSLIEASQYKFNYHEFITKLDQFQLVVTKAFLNLKEQRHALVQKQKQQLRLEEFKPRVLSSFVRNKLINKVYLPLIGDNLAKQLGTVGGNQRTDRMGMLLLISPPGYGKTTLMEYVANRLGLTFMKINGPSIGHDIVSVDPGAAKTATAKEELKKLNLALEMENNVMLYLDDIQHCNPEFLQKFISLADGQRKMEGVYNGVSKTYDLRGKKFCVIMAGNPYTESGEKFQIPDMLSNRADIYNLGDIIGDSDTLFKMSLIENALTANPQLRALTATRFEDVYSILQFIDAGKQDSLQLKGKHTAQDIEAYVAVLEKVLKIRDIVLKVNANYIKSASMDDANRTEPPFKLQGSYRDMNKMVAKVVPIMNADELQTLINTHYENESQTLTSATESNMLKFKELAGILNDEEDKRWEEIKATFQKNNAVSANNQVAQIVSELSKFSNNLEGIKEVLKRNINKE